MYKKLFEPMKINNCEIPNRLVVTAMVTNYCNEDGTAAERFVKYHEEKAKGGWGLIITEDYAINENAKRNSSLPRGALNTPALPRTAPFRTHRGTPTR